MSDKNKMRDDELGSPPNFDRRMYKQKPPYGDPKEKKMTPKEGLKEQKIHLQERKISSHERKLIRKNLEKGVKGYAGAEKEGFTHTNKAKGFDDEGEKEE